MTDRELLELAAKAAGVSGMFIEKTPEDGHPNYSCGIGNSGRLNPLWNPLTNDGAALRLAVNLQLGIELYGVGSSVKGCHELANGDPYAATRRAIVRAAAEIGKQMTEPSK